jgi:hypothetical protein
MDLEKISALFEKRFEKIEKDFKEQVNSLREDNVKLREEVVKQNEIITRLDGDNVKLREEVVKQSDIIIRLDGELALLRQDNTLLNSTVSRLEIDNAEALGDLRILHPLPYARLHLQHCIERQEACNAELNAFHHRYLTDTIISNPVLTLRERELRAALKSAWDARFAAAHLCEPPPTLVNTLWLIAKNGYEEEIKKCLNLNKATRTCKQLQAVMREVKRKNGCTQLNYFALNGMTESVKRMLLIKGIEIESKDIYGNTPLNNAALIGRIKICKLLLDHGAKIESKGNLDATPLFCACQEGHLSVVSLLIARGADIEASDIDGWRPLHIAALKGHLEIVKALIARHFDMNALTNDGETALGIARREKHPSIISYLQSLGAIDDGIVEEEEEEEENEENEDEDEYRHHWE